MSNGKLDNIRTVRNLLPSIGDLRLQCQNAGKDLETMLVRLRDVTAQKAKEQAEREMRKSKEEEYKGLIQQREQAKIIAENIVNAKITGETLATKPKEVQEATPVRVAPTPSVPFQSKKSGLFGRPGEPDTSFAKKQYNNNNGFKPHRTEAFAPRPNQGQTRFGNNNRPPFNNNAGARAPYTPNGVRRTWTPGQATAGGYGSKTYGTRPQFNNNRTTGNFATGFGLPRPTEKFVPKPNTFDNRKNKGNSSHGEERSQVDRRSLLRRGIIEEQEIEERMLTRIFRTKKPKENTGKEKAAKDNKIIIDTNNLTVKVLSEKIGITVPQIIKQLMVLGQMCTINSVIDFTTAELVSGEFGIVIEQGAKETYEEKMTAIHHVNKDEGNTQPRPPVVTIMGHVDHGKTTLLDRLRNSNVAKGEHGGITQHIGAYQVEVAKDKKITFLDTPGHAAFDKMRARGAKITDVAILIVAGDDGVMPQTVEAIKHIQGQGLPMIVAVNKCDKPTFDLEHVRNQLSEHNVISEEWGGDTIIVPISAANGEGIPKLLEMILLVADMKNCRANYNKEATGAIIEAKLDATKGPIVTILVQNGTLHMGDTLLAGTTYGKVRTMKDDLGHTVKTATPGMPVQITGFGEVPNAGDNIFVVDEKLTKQVVAERKNKEKVTRANKGHNLAEFDPLAEMKKTDKKQLNIILKADVSGSLEAITQSINNITSDEVNINIIGRGVGSVTDNDVDLASITNALVIAFHAKTTSAVQKTAEKLKVKIHSFHVIYEIFDFVTEQMVKLFTPKFEQDYIGRAEVRKVFKTSTAGTIAGCMVLDGKVARGYLVKVIRGDNEIGKYAIDSLKIKTEDVKEIQKGNECGIKLKDMPELAEGDIFEIVGEHQQPIIFNGKEYKF